MRLISLLIFFSVVICFPSFGQAQKEAKREIHAAMGQYRDCMFTLSNIRSTDELAKLRDPTEMLVAIKASCENEEKKLQLALQRSDLPSEKKTSIFKEFKGEVDKVVATWLLRSFAAAEFLERDSVQVED